MYPFCPAAMEGRSSSLVDSDAGADADADAEGDSGLERCLSLDADAAPVHRRLLSSAPSSSIKRLRHLIQSDRDHELDFRTWFDRFQASHHDLVHWLNAGSSNQPRISHHAFDRAHRAHLELIQSWVHHRQLLDQIMSLETECLSISRSYPALLDRFSALKHQARSARDKPSRHPSFAALQLTDARNQINSAQNLFQLRSAQLVQLKAQFISSSLLARSTAVIHFCRQLQSDTKTIVDLIINAPFVQQHQGPIQLECLSQPARAPTTAASPQLQAHGHARSSFETGNNSSPTISPLSPPHPLPSHIHSLPPSGHDGRLNSAAHGTYYSSTLPLAESYPSSFRRHGTQYVTSSTSSTSRHAYPIIRSPAPGLPRPKSAIVQRSPQARAAPAFRPRSARASTTNNERRGSPLFVPPLLPTLHSASSQQSLQSFLVRPGSYTPPPSSPRVQRPPFSRTSSKQLPARPPFVIPTGYKRDPAIRGLDPYGDLESENGDSASIEAGNAGRNHRSVISNPLDSLKKLWSKKKMMPSIFLFTSPPRQHKVSPVLVNPASQSRPPQYQSPAPRKLRQKTHRGHSHFPKAPEQAEPEVPTSIWPSYPRASIANQQQPRDGTPLDPGDEINKQEKTRQVHGVEAAGRASNRGHPPIPSCQSSQDGLPHLGGLQSPSNASGIRLKSHVQDWAGAQATISNRYSNESNLTDLTVTPPVGQSMKNELYSPMSPTLRHSLIEPDRGFRGRQVSALSVRLEADSGGEQFTSLKSSSQAPRRQPKSVLGKIEERSSVVPLGSSSGVMMDERNMAQTDINGVEEVERLRNDAEENDESEDDDDQTNGGESGDEYYKAREFIIA